MFVTKKRFKEVEHDLEDMREKHSMMVDLYKGLHSNVKEVCKAWKDGRIGNLRAINTIAKGFSLDKPQHALSKKKK